MKTGFSICFLILSMAVFASGCGTTEGSSRPAGSDGSAGAAMDTEIAAPEPLPPVEPYRIPQNTAIRVRLLHAVSSKTASPGDSFEAEVSQAVKIGSTIVIHRGSRVRGGGDVSLGGSVPDQARKVRNSDARAIPADGRSMTR